MGIFDLLRPGRLRIAWTYSAAGVIWRTYPAYGGKIVGEERDLERKHVRFFCVDQHSGLVLWDKRSYDEEWWIGIAGMSSGTLFLHSYATPELPEHKSIIGVDLKSGRKLWANKEMHFVSASDATLIAYRDSIEGRMHCELDSRTGELLNTLEAEGLGAALREKETGVRFPEPLEDVAVIRGYCDLQRIEGPVGAIQHGNLLIFNVHERTAEGRTTDPGVNNTLKVADRKNGRILFNDLLMRNAPAIVPESFFVQSDMLFYVKERNILTAINLERRLRDHQTRT